MPRTDNDSRDRAAVWRPVRTPLNQLLAEAGLPLQRTDPDALFAQNY